MIENTYFYKWGFQLPVLKWHIGCCYSTHIFIRYNYGKGCYCLRWGRYDFTERLVNDKEWEKHELKKSVDFKYIFHIKKLRLRLFKLERVLP